MATQTDNSLHSKPEQTKSLSTVPSKPSDIDLSEGTFLSTFGESHLEHCIYDLVKWLVEHGDSWETKFRMKGTSTIALDLVKIPEAPIEPMWFAIMCRSWIIHTWFPKGSYEVDKALIERLEQSTYGLAQRLSKTDSQVEGKKNATEKKAKL